VEPSTVIAALVQMQQITKALHILVAPVTTLLPTITDLSGLFDQCESRQIAGWCLALLPIPPLELGRVSGHAQMMDTVAMWM
jgi:hypothetical protein